LAVCHPAVLWKQDFQRRSRGRRLEGDGRERLSLEIYLRASHVLARCCVSDVSLRAGALLYDLEAACTRDDVHSILERSIDRFCRGFQMHAFVLQLGLGASFLRLQFGQQAFLAVPQEGGKLAEVCFETLLLFHHLVAKRLLELAEARDQCQ